jgi:hypothetical protein
MQQGATLHWPMIPGLIWNWEMYILEEISIEVWLSTSWLLTESRVTQR